MFLLFSTLLVLYFWCFAELGRHEILPDLSRAHIDHHEHSHIYSDK
jgi:hypothetical protein